MNPKTIDLLAAVGAAPEKNPILISLLELGAQSPRARGDFPVLRVRLSRQWQRVCVAFRACVADHVTDKILRAALPFEGLEFTDEAGWKITAADPLTYRVHVANALEALAGGKGRELVPFEIRTIEELRRAQRRNGIAPFDSPLVLPKAFCGRLLEGRHVVISRVLDGVKCWTALQFDEFGRGRVVAHVMRRGTAHRACRPKAGGKKKK